MCMYVLYSYFNSDANFLSCTALNHMVKEKLVPTKECHFIHIHEQDIGMLSLLLWYQIHALLNKLECICNDNISVAAFENQSYLYWISHRSLNVETITKNWLLWCKMNARRFWSWLFFLNRLVLWYSCFLAVLICHCSDYEMQLSYHGIPHEKWFNFTKKTSNIAGVRHIFSLICRSSMRLTFSTE